MYLLVVVISLLLSSVPARSRPVEDFNEKIFWKSGNITEKNDMPVPNLIETNQNAGQGMDGPLITFGDIAVPTGFQNADPCTARRCKWRKSRNGLVYVPYKISNQYSPDEIKVIKQGLNSFTGISCIRFVPHNGQRDFLNIKSDSGFAFSKNNEPTMIPIPNRNVVIGEARKMSPNDILRINKLYCRMLSLYYHLN
ncbi:hypothetical protein cypCar_00042959 [Cyprinus carpio]|nr:hypothetical protein cypCar_00042959 [Cyprinus carpio]